MKVHFKKVVIWAGGMAEVVEHQKKKKKSNYKPTL
jgi:hypothetical protein